MRRFTGVLGARRRATLPVLSILSLPILSFLTLSLMTMAATVPAGAAGELQLIEYTGTAPPVPKGPPGVSLGAPMEVPLGPPQGYLPEVEPNGTSATATPLGGSSVAVFGTVFPANDVDFYSFTAAMGDRVYAATQTLFDASASGDSVLDVIATDGTTVLENDPNDGTFNASSASIAGTLIPSAGTYFLRVRHNVATGTIRPYHLHFRLQSGAPVAEVEPNNTPATATPLPASGWASGTVTAVSPGESDFFSLTLAAGDSVYLSLDMNPERDASVWNGRLGFALFGNPPANQILLANDANAGAAPADPNSEAFYFTVLTAGTYFVYVDSIVAAGLGANATYNLSVTVHPFVAPTPTCTTFTNNTPVAIPTGPGMVTSTISVPGSPRIADLDVSINLNHTFMQDLDVHLVSPAGNDNGLFTDIGASTVGGAQTLMDIRLDDEAALPFAFALSSSLAIQPELAYRLWWFDGENAGGDWILTLRDDATGDGGTLNSWSLTICEPEPLPTCPPGAVLESVFTTDFESGDAGFTHSGVLDEWELGLPTFIPITTCNSGVNCWKTDLDNSYNASSSQDLLSPNIDLSAHIAPVTVSWAQRYHIESANFDHASVDIREAGGANPTRLFEWLDATMNNTVGNPTVTIAESSGWSLISASADAYAGLNTELNFHLDSDTTVQLAGLAIDDVTVTACRVLSADLSITKTDGTATATPGGMVTYTINASNAGPDTVLGATVSDTFPAALTCTWTCVGMGGATCTAGPVAGNINDSADLPAGGSAIYTAVCTIDPGATGSLVNTATVSSMVADPDNANNSATDTDTLTPSADLQITKTDGVATATPGGSVTYTIVASNAGLSNVPSATVADTFPASLTCTWTCTPAGGATCTAGPVAGNINDAVSLPAGSSASYSATCTISASATGSLVNTATVSSGVTDPNPANNSATDTDTLTPSADLSITKTDGVTNVPPGGMVTYTIVASNAGLSNVPSATVADTFPAVLTCNWTCSSAGGATCTSGPVAGNINDAVSLPVGGSVTYSAVCTIDAGASGSLVNTATVSSAVTDPNAANNSATDTDTIGSSADLSITKTDGVTTVIPGAQVTYTIVASNAGPTAVPSAMVVDNFPTSACSWTCAGMGGGTCTPGPDAGNINDTVNLPVGASVTYTATCTIDPGTTGNLVNTATVSSGVMDPNTANNSATDTDTLTPSADLGVTKSDGQTMAAPGQMITYTIEVSNFGISNAPGASVSDTFPAALNGVTWTCSGSGGGTCTAAGAGNIADSVNLPAGASVTYMATGTVDGGFLGVLSNTAMVTPPAGVDDPIAGNNTATDQTTVVGGAVVSGLKSVAGSFQVGGTVEYTIVLTNDGVVPQSDNPGDELIDVLPPELTLVSASATSGTAVADVGTNTVTWNGSIPANGGSVTITIEATINPEAEGTTVSNQAMFNFDSDGDGDNDASDVTEDPDTGGPTAFNVAGAGADVIDIPSLSSAGLALLALLLTAVALTSLRRRRA